MEAVRSCLVVTGRPRSNEFKPDNANLSPFMQRLARAHANCIESIPVFGGLLIVAIATGRSEITDPLAFVASARACGPIHHSPRVGERRCGQRPLQLLSRADGHRRLLGLGPGRGIGASPEHVLQRLPRLDGRPSL